MSMQPTKEQRIVDLEAQLESYRERDRQIESMIRYGHSSEGWGTRAVMDIWTVLSGGNQWRT